MERVAEFEDRTQSAGTGEPGNTRAAVRPLRAKRSPWKSGEEMGPRDFYLERQVNNKEER